MRIPLRLLAAAVCLTLPASASAQMNRNQPKLSSMSEEYDCPKCGKKIVSNNGEPPNFCPHCQTKLGSTQNLDGTVSLNYVETQDNPYKKPLLIGGGVVIALGILAIVLKSTVFATPKPKKKRRREDDDDEDRPRQKKRRPPDDDK